LYRVFPSLQSVSGTPEGSGHKGSNLIHFRFSFLNHPTDLDEPTSLWHQFF